MPDLSYRVRNPGQLRPISGAHDGCQRLVSETFSLAMAIQNLLWGIGVPVAGAIADRFGTAKVVALGAAVYAVGVAGMAMSDSGLALHLTGGVLVGLGVAFCSFSLVLAAIARLIGPGRRSLALGLGTAAGSLGQVIFSPINQALISRYGWYDSLLVMSVVSLVLIPLAFSLRGSSESRGEPASDQGLTNALGEAVNHRSYLLLTAGFFVCGFHVAFITVHFPDVRHRSRSLGSDRRICAFISRPV